jgi:hypothetical protein
MNLPAALEDTTGRIDRSLEKELLPFGCFLYGFLLYI